MAEEFSGSLNVVLNATLAGDLDLGSGNHKVSKIYQNSYTNGTGAGQANNMFADTRTVSSSSTDSLDLYGSLTNAFGTTLNFANIKAICIKADSGNGSTITLGGNANPFALFGTGTDKISLPAGAMLMIADPTSADGFDVTDSTGDTLDITNDDSSNSATYEITIVGEV